MNTGRAGAWANLATLGQGQLIDVDAANQFIFLSWFTYTDANSPNPNEQRWLTAQGPFAGSTAEIAVYETLGGSFDDPQPTETTPIGTMTIDFSNCRHAQLGYALTDGSGSGQINLARLLPDAGGLCESLSGTD